MEHIPGGVQKIKVQMESVALDEMSNRNLCDIPMLPGGGIKNMGRYQQYRASLCLALSLLYYAQPTEQNPQVILIPNYLQADSLWLCGSGDM